MPNRFKDTPTAELLAKLNYHRAIENRPPLKAWKEKRDALVSLVAKLEQPTPAPAKRHKAKHNGDFAQWCAKHKMGQKQARSKLRRHGFEKPYAITDETTAVLLGDARKKGEA